MEECVGERGKRSGVWISGDERSKENTLLRKGERQE